MIVSFRDERLRAFFVDDVRSRNIPADLESRLFRKLQMIDDAMTDQDLRVPPSNHFEKLRGNLAGLHWIRVNKQWRPEQFQRKWEPVSRPELRPDENSERLSDSTKSESALIFAWDGGKGEASGVYLDDHSHR